MISIDFTVTSEDVDAYLDYSFKRARRNALWIGGGFGFLVGISVALVSWWQSGIPAVGLVCGAIPAAILIGPALRDRSRVKWAEELAKWNVPDSIPTGRLTLSINEDGLTLTRHGNVPTGNGCGDNSLLILAGKQDVGWAFVDVSTTPRHVFLLQPFYHAWVVPLHALPPAERAALLTELDAWMAAKRKLSGGR